MLPEIGQFALILALALALIQGTLPLWGATKNLSPWMRLARPVAQGQSLFVVLAFGCLVVAFINNDFSVLYVASNSNSALPLAYRIAAVWGGHEGSMLLWILMLSMWTLAVSFFSDHLPLAIVSRVLGVLGLVSIGFLSFLLFTSNPFERLIPAAMDGRDLNPLLQDPGMVIHPPMLYMGYVGFSVAFAFAIAALLSGQLDATWARWSRPWTTVAWSFLTIGIALGSAWAYYELGWGGWWFWDPVENASFMPWLVGTALIHSLAVTEKRGSFKSWTVLLAILAFALSLLGTFLVRSGVLTSVHAFATDPKRGIYILIFLTLVIGSSLLLYALRAHRVGLGGRFALVSRESMLLANNVLLVVAAASVLLGTLYPLILDALNLGKISVGPPYFDAVFLPLMSPALFLMGVGPIARWKEARVPPMVIRLRWAFVVSLVSALLLPLTMGQWLPLTSFAFLLSLWIALSSLTQLFYRWRLNPEQNWLSRIKAPSLSYYGMLVAHLGVAVFVLGVTMVKSYDAQVDVPLRVGQSVPLQDYTFHFDAIDTFQGPNYTGMRATIGVKKDGVAILTLYPEKRLYTVQKNATTEAAIDSGWTRDLYVSLGEPVSDNRWVIRFQIKPFVDWIWGGCLLMALGGLLAVMDRRYRLKSQRTIEAPEAAQRPLAPLVATTKGLSQ